MLLFNKIVNFIIGVNVVKKGKYLIFTILIISMLLSGCNLYATPSSLIKSPKLSENVIKNNINLNDEDIKALAQKFMPEKAKILEENKIVTKKNYYIADLDGDYENELVVFFKDEENFKRGFFVLKNKENKWTKVYEKSVEGTGISMLQFLPVCGVDNRCLLVGFHISGHAGGEYYAYDFTEKDVKEIELGRWNKFDILSTPVKDEKKGFVFGVQIYEAGSEYNSYIIRFNGSNFSAAKDYYESYFKENVKYYQEDLSGERRNQLSWYYLIESEIKAGLYEEALKSINEVFKIKESKEPTVMEVGYYKFLILKATALNGLKRYEEAENILISLSKVSLQNENDFFYYEPKEFALSEIYFQLGEVYKGLSKKDEAKTCYYKSLDMLNKLSKEGIFNTDSTSKIIKEVLINPITEELKNL